MTSLELAVAPTPVAIIIISISACRVYRNLRVQAMRPMEISEGNFESIKFDLPQHNDLRSGAGMPRSEGFLSSK